MRKSIRKTHRNKSKRRNKSKKRINKRRTFRRTGGSANYSPEDMESFKKWIADLSESSPRDIEQKNWLLNNYERMPYETDYEFNWSMDIDDPSEKSYYQGIDRMSGYLHGFGGW